MFWAARLRRRAIRANFGLVPRPRKCASIPAAPSWTAPSILGRTSPRPRGTRPPRPNVRTHRAGGKAEGLAGFDFLNFFSFETFTEGASFSSPLVLIFPLSFSLGFSFFSLPNGQPISGIDTSHSANAVQRNPQPGRMKRKDVP